MISITDALVAEHRVFAEIFDQIEDCIPQVTTVAEVKLLAKLVERMLQGHAQTENDLAYSALDQVLGDTAVLDRLHQDHKEIDASLERALASNKFDEARRMLRAAIGASREHFKREERSVFPFIEKVLQAETLAALGAARIQTRPVSAA